MSEQTSGDDCSIDQTGKDVEFVRDIGASAVKPKTKVLKRIPINDGGAIITVDAADDGPEHQPQSRFTLSNPFSELLNPFSEHHELYQSLNSSQLEYIERLSTGLAYIFRMPVEKGVLSDEKVLYAVKRVMHALSVIQSGREKSIIDVEMIGKDKIDLIKKTLIESPCKRICFDVNVAVQEAIMSRLPELTDSSAKISGFDITASILNDLLSRRGISNTSSDKTSRASNEATTPCTCNILPEVIEASLAKYKLQVCGNEMTLLEAVKKLRSALDGMKLYCPKTFANENGDIIDVLLEVGLFTGSTRVLLQQVCTYLIGGRSGSVSDKKSTITAFKIKKLLRSSFRRYQLKPRCKSSFQGLSAKISKSAEELEPGEEVDHLWSVEIEKSFNALLKSQHEHICKTNTTRHYQEKWFKKFVGFLAAKHQLWPKGMMTPEFLKNKAYEFLETLKPQSTEKEVKVPVVANVEKALSNNDLNKIKNYSKYRDYDKPAHAARDVIFKDLRHLKTGSSMPDESEQNLQVGLSTNQGSSSTTSSFPNDPQSGKRRRIPRHRSDESVVESESGSASNSHRQKRHSSDSLYSEQDRSNKRPKFQEMTDYDRKLQSFQVWDPLVSVTDTKFKEVFKTKEEAPENRALEKQKLNSSPEPPLAQTSEKDRESTSKEKDSVVLKASYGDMTVVTEDNNGDGVSVVITIQGYVFQGVAPSWEEAVEKASRKALLLAPFILQKPSQPLTSFPEET